MANKDQSPACCYLVTGANSGIGLEATKQLAWYLWVRYENSAKIYMLCRSEERARAAMETVGTPEILRFIKFDADETAESIQKECVDKVVDALQEDAVVIRGILLNAGGFGEYKPNRKKHAKANEESSSTSFSTATTLEHPVACCVAQSNIIGHAILIDRLLTANKIDSSTRIVASGSEASFASGVRMDFEAADFDGILMGTVSLRGGTGVAYAWTKAILSLYWAAFARHRPDLFVVTVSPGAVSSTNLLEQEGVDRFLRRVSKTAMVLRGSHRVSEAAKRYIDALLGEEDRSQVTGSFWASRKGYTKDYGDVSSLKIGKFVGDVSLQDKAWFAVNKFITNRS